MKKQLVTAALAMALIGAQAPAFAEQPAADGKTETQKGYIVVQGEKGPEVKEVDVTGMQSEIQANRKLYATVNLPQELGLDKRSPLLLRQLGLLADQAVEAEDVSTLVSLSLSLAAFEKTAGKQAASLSSKDLLRLAGELAAKTQNKAGMELVAQAYQDAAFGLTDKEKADEFTQLAENTRGFLDEVLLPAVIVGGAAVIAYELSTNDLTVDSYAYYGLDIYADGDYLGYVGSRGDRTFQHKKCDRTVRLEARASGSTVASASGYLPCGAYSKWTIH